MRDRTDRIAVIGGGVAGCAAARRLTDLGYAAVTLFEAEGRIGGKVCTRFVDGKPYEMGAVVMTGAYINTFKTLDRLGLKTTSAFRARHFDRARRTYREKPPSLALIRQLWAFRTFMKAHGDALSEPGSWALDPDLCRPFTDWARSKGFPLVADPLTAIVTCLGYGRLSEVSAAYVLKFMSYRSVNALILAVLWDTIVPQWLNRDSPSLRVMPSGMQQIPERLCAGLDVRLNAPVTAIEPCPATSRSGALGYRVSSGAESADAETFDAVVFATVPSGIAGLETILPPAVQERVSQIRYQRYTSILCRADGIEAGCTYLNRLDGRAMDPEGDRLACILRMHRTSNACVLYHISDEPTSDGDLEAAIARSFAELGATLRETIEVRRWSYFPHFDGPALAQDPYAIFEAAQGVDGLYYAGAYLDFELVENSLATTLKIVDRQFGPATPGRAIPTARAAQHA